MWATTLLLAAAVAGAETTGLTLQLTATKPKIFMGEPLKVLVVWSASQPIAVNVESVKLMLDDGTGFKQHVETQTQTRSVIQAPVNLAAGESRVTAYVLSVSGGGMPPSEKTVFRFAFPQPGRYRLVADYFGLTSNVVTIEVKAPEGKDADLYAKYLRARPELLNGWAFMNLRSQDDAELAAKLLDEHRGSPYLGRLQMLSWEQQIGAALSTHYESVESRAKDPL